MPANAVAFFSPSLTITNIPTKGFAVIAAEKIAKGQMVVQFAGEIISKPSMHSVQIGEHEHIDVKGNERFVNHSSTPNTAMRFEHKWPQLITLVDIDAGDEITFNYNTSEWTMAKPFTDENGRLVQGFSHLSKEEQAALLTHCAPYIRARVSSSKCLHEQTGN